MRILNFWREKKKTKNIFYMYWDKQEKRSCVSTRTQTHSRVSTLQKKHAHKQGERYVILHAQNLLYKFSQANNNMSSYMNNLISL
jgi:hypothetical protein